MTALNKFILYCHESLNHSHSLAWVEGGRWGEGVGPSYERDGGKVDERVKLNYYRKLLAVIMC